MSATGMHSDQCAQIQDEANQGKFLLIGRYGPYRRISLGRISGFAATRDRATSAQRTR